MPSSQASNASSMSMDISVCDEPTASAPPNAASNGPQRTKDELEEVLKSTLRELTQLDEERLTVREERMFLNSISMKVKHILEAGMNGSYQHHFFTAVDQNPPTASGENGRFFRAIVQQLNKDFTSCMRLRGCTYALLEGEDQNLTTAANLERIRHQANFSAAFSFTRPQAIEWVLRYLYHYHNNGNPGTAAPRVISQLFVQMSEPWKKLATQHIDRVVNQCFNFIGTVLNYATRLDISDRIMRKHVFHVLDEAASNAKEELAQLLVDKDHHTWTSAQHFAARVHTGAGPAMQNKTAPDLRISTGNDLLNTLCAYYADQFEYFIAAVVNQVIERHIITPLSEKIFSDIVVAGMTQEEVRDVVGEKREVMEIRKELETRRELLEKELRVFNWVLESEG
ncbi:hypothetical protein FB567DRAFT_617790 [Paraphoma chrysanthemicola]|uniref:GED domain-containing protein n=1 Tax=Paraphoma chrysanthemicola TaxID=798071 RepID=A0A8K0W1C1_9PLEO|nr:hypothetical protein FB567DRAFT_617790 [Paraphoma chrysanthemicola]